MAEIPAPKVTIEPIAGGGNFRLTIALPAKRLTFTAPSGRYAGNLSALAVDMERILKAAFGIDQTIESLILAVENINSTRWQNNGGQP